MKKYTIKEFAEGKKAVKIENEEQWNKLNKVHKLTTDFKGSCFYCNKQTYFANWGSSKIAEYGIETLEFSQLDFEEEFVEGSWYKYNGWFLKFQTIIKGNTFIASETIDPNGVYENRENEGFTCGDADKTKVLLTDLSEIQPFLPSNHQDLIKKDTFVLPEYWWIQRNKENYEIVNDWFTENGYGNPFSADTPIRINDSKDNYKTDEVGTEITFEQFKTHILKESTMEKEIVEYKLKFAEYIKAANTIIGTSTDYTKSGFIPDSVAYKKLKEAGVLDLWFEKVYAPEFKKDDYVTVVSIGTYDYNSSSGDTRPVIGKTYKIYNVSTTYVDLDTPGGIIVIKSSDLRKATEDEVKKAQIQLPTINGKRCVDNGDKTITCGCTTKSFDWILGVDYAMGEEIDISGTKVSDKEIRQIVEYINNK